MNGNEQMKGLQNRKKGTERVQTKLGKTHVDYWYSKLRKRFFSGRDGLQVQVPDWQVRLKHLGRSMWFNLKTAKAAEAAVKARDIYIYLIANGWEAALEKFKPQTEKRENLSVEEFADLYREKIELVEYPPIIRTVALPAVTVPWPLVGSKCGLSAANPSSVVSGRLHSSCSTLASS
jgi:hypothetical protein